ncbi:MAG TPA: hypothetical protein VGD67_29355, partial [Pseudonocardiaceae bacterium]
AGVACDAAGRVDGRLALWRLDAGGSWTEATGLPAIAVGDTDPLAAPVEFGGARTTVLPDGDDLTLLRAEGDRWTVRRVTGPTGRVTALAVAGNVLYLVAGPDADHRGLWRADLSALTG